MSKNKNKKNEEEFENIFANADFNDEFGEEDGLFDDENYQDEEYDDEEYEEYGEDQQLATYSEESSSGIMSKVDVANLAKDNKLATAGIIGAVGFGLWKVFGSKEEGSQNAPQQNQGSVPQSYDDEFLDLDEEDSIDDFIDQNQNQRINPMFTPLRFK